MKSIRKTLTRRLSITISLLVIVVLLAADIGVDTWVQREFNQGLKAKVGMLQSLVNEDLDGVEFEFAGEYFPEFEGASSPEYFQLWYKGQVFEKSESLALYTVDELPFENLSLNEAVINDITLPDGRSGRIIHTKYVPQIDSEDREAFYNVRGEEQRDPMVIAYATSTELLNFTLWFIDIAFLVALIVIPLMVRFVVRNTVSYALAPLDALNNNIRTLRFTATDKHEAFSTNVSELEPIVSSLNHFINDNYALYLREKRLTSDIAHELKTPVSELINLAEVAMKFPGEERLEKDFKPQILRIGMRMKNIISGLMLIQKHSAKQTQLNDLINIKELVAQVVASKAVDNINVVAKERGDVVIHSNRIAVESIFSNLLDNAIEHGKHCEPISVYIGKTQTGQAQIEVTNTTHTEIDERDLRHMFEPLWQKDASRTSEDNFGLGLSIVSALCGAIGADVSVYKLDHNHISFSVTFKKAS